MTEEEYDGRVWDRLQGNLGRPPHADIRYPAMFKELKGWPIEEVEKAVEMWIRGEGGDEDAGKRFPKTAHLLAILRKHRAERDRERDVTAYKPDAPQFSQLTDQQLADHLKWCEIEWQKLWLKKQGKTAVPQMEYLMLGALVNTLKIQYSLAKQEMERRLRSATATLPQGR